MKSMAVILQKGLSVSMLAALATGSTFGAALAQAGGNVLEEITVTAQKREESLQTVPVAMTAFSGNAINDLNIAESVDIAFHTPGLTFGTPVGEGNNPSITLRGVGLNDFSDNNESPVAIYIDEVYMAAMAGQTFQLYDLERVEVLRGPQGTLFGRNATGGLLHFITKKPTPEWEYMFSGTYGRKNMFSVKGAVGGPISDSVQFRISAAANDHDGYVTNRFDEDAADSGGGDRNERNNRAIRGQLLFLPNPDASILLKAEWAKSDVSAAVYQHQGTGLDLEGGLCETSEALAGQCTDFFGYRDADGDPFAGSYDRDGPLTIETATFSGNVSWDLSELITLTSITAYSTVEKLHQEDTDMSPLSILEPTFQIEDSDKFTQEVRLSGRHQRLQWVAGVYYFNWDLDAPQDLQFGADLIPTFWLDTEVRQETESWAVFGQVEYNLTPELAILAGGRWTKEDKEYEYVQVDRLGGVAGLPPGTVLLDFNKEAFGDLAVFDDGVFSGKVGLNWEVTPRTFLFANVSRGFKSGGFNAGFTSAPPDRLKYANEILWSYEAGIKQTFLNRRLRVNLTGFYYDYSDRQTLSFAQFGSFIGNADTTEVYGGELEVQGQPVENLDINLGLSLLNSNADGVTLPDGSVVDGRDLVLAPEVSANGLVRYTVPLGQGRGSLGAQVDVSYVSSHFFDIQNQPIAKEDGYDVWGASVTWKNADGNFEVKAWGRNIFGEEYLVYTFDFTGDFGFNQLFYGRPSWWGVTGTARF